MIPERELTHANVGVPPLSRSDTTSGDGSRLPGEVPMPPSLTNPIGVEDHRDTLRILYHHRIGSKDGQAVHIESLLAALRQAGHQVCVVAPPSFVGVTFGSEAKWLAHLRQRLPRAAYEVMEVLYNITILWRLRRAYPRFRPDLIYERYNLFTIAGVVFARLYKLPIFLEVNSPLAAERAAFGGLALSRFAAWLERQTWRAADMVLPVSSVLAELVRAAGVPPDRIAVIPNGIDEEAFCDLDHNEAKKTLGLAGKVVIGFTGFVREWHGLREVLEILSDPRCPADLHLLIVGDGPASPNLRVYSERLEVLSRVTFAGLVDRELVPRYLSAFDIALQPKAVRYASPLKIFEYMAAGKAIVAPDQANIREILINGETALLFESGNIAAFHDAILALACNAPLRERLGRAACRAIFARQYTWTENARRIASLHAEVRQHVKSEQQAVTDPS
jgi:glycosyltransferase involved in cell wall biosynthesis